MAEFSARGVKVMRCTKREISLLMRMEKNDIKLGSMSILDLIALRSLIRKGFAEETRRNKFSVTRYLDKSGKKKLVVFQVDQSGIKAIGKFEIAKEFSADSYEPNLTEIPFVPTNRTLEQ